MKDATKKKRKRSPAQVAGLLLLGVTIVLMITLAMFTSFDEVTNVFTAKPLDIVLTETKWKPQEAKNVVPEQELDKNPSIYNNEETDAFVFLEVTVPYLPKDAVIEKNSPDNQKGKPFADYNNNIDNIVPLYKFGIQTAGRGTEETIDDVYEYDTTYVISDSAHAYDQKINSGWALVETPTVNTTSKTITYVYAHVYSTGDKAGKLYPLMHGYPTEYPLFDRIRVVNFRENASIDDTKNYNISIKAYGIQTGYLGPNNTSIDDPAQVWAVVKAN